MIVFPSLLTAVNVLIASVTIANSPAAAQQALHPQAYINKFVKEEISAVQAQAPPPNIDAIRSLPPSCVPNFVRKYKGSLWSKCLFILDVRAYASRPSPLPLPICFHHGDNKIPYDVRPVLGFNVALVEKLQEAGKSPIYYFDSRIGLSEDRDQDRDVACERGFWLNNEAKLISLGTVYSNLKPIDIIIYSRSRPMGQACPFQQH